MQSFLRMACAAAMLAAFIVSSGCGQSATRANVARAHPAEPRDLALKLATPKNGRTRPMVVVLADNAGTETTDFVVPYGVLKESGVADVVTVSTGPGAVALMPVLRILPDMTIAQFDAATPSGADILIVPAMRRNDDPALLDWVRIQHRKGATVVSICEGASLVANAGLLEGRIATTHWFALDTMAEKFPGTTWMLDRRWVVDGKIISTTGVSASVPASLALVEAIAGRPAALRTAQRLGVNSWDTEHDSSAFAFDARQFVVIAWNWLAFWRHETLVLPIADGFDDISLALTADAWARTLRSRVVSTHAGGTVRSRHGLVFESAMAPADSRYRLTDPQPVAKIDLDAILAGIAARYGPTTARWVAMGLEHRPRLEDTHVPGCDRSPACGE